MQLTVGRIREAIKGLPDTAVVKIDVKTVDFGRVDEGSQEPPTEALEAIPDHAKSTLTIKV